MIREVRQGAGGQVTHDRHRMAPAVQEDYDVVAFIRVQLLNRMLHPEYDSHAYPLHDDGGWTVRESEKTATALILQA